MTKQTFHGKMKEKTEVRIMRFGYCVNMIAADAYGIGYDWIPRLAELGFDYVDLPMAQMMTLDDANFQELVLAPLRASGLPCVCVNNLFPASIRLTGPDAAPETALDYCRRAFARAEALGATRAVFGSSGARNVPAGWPREAAFHQLADLLRELAPLAAAHGITLVIEPLNRGESNILSGIAESIRLCSTVSHENVRMLVDFYHMALSGESPADAAAAGNTLRHVHLARPLGRGLPYDGDGEDYAAFFAALHSIGYDGEVSIEAYVPDRDEQAIQDALHYLRSFSCAQEERTRITGLMHIAIHAADMRRSADFYCRVLGGEQVFTVNAEDGEPSMMYIRLAPGQYIEMFRAVPGAEAVSSPVGFTHLCLTVPDIQAAAEELRRHNWPIRVEPKAGKYGNYQLWIRDPDGMDIELMQTLPDFLGGNA